MLFLFFFNDTATTEIYTLSLHDALPISARRYRRRRGAPGSRTDHGDAGSRTCPPRESFMTRPKTAAPRKGTRKDRKSTRLNSSHANISYAVFCLKKKKKPLISDSSRQQP